MNITCYFEFLVEDKKTPRGGVRLPRIKDKKEPEQKYRPYGKYEEQTAGKHRLL